MNDKQRNVLSLGVLVAVLMAIFTPWSYTDSGFAGHAPLWDPPYVGYSGSIDLFALRGGSSLEIDIPLLMLQWLLVAAVTAVLIKTSPKAA